MSAFDRLHPALQHHIVNSLRWRKLRSLQEEAIEPILDGEHVLLIAPTAGGKTEAAVFPVLSRMLAEDWRGITVLYVCPIKALLNDLEVRLSRYAELLGRRVKLWHGDVGPAERRRTIADPPDILLTTPESIEAMLIFRRADREALFGRVRTVVVDELHAFAGDDRGWHLLAVLQRVTRIAGRELQRLGLSATIGNPDELLSWLRGGEGGAGRVVSPQAEPAEPPEVLLDHVETIENAALVISRLDRGEKRLVFCDSRARVERLAGELRPRGVDTYVSHSSLSVDERRRAERAFAEAHDCVIVATSTLELGIDVGDLDRVIQIDAPATVASVLQRMGRTGRRPGTRRNVLFLTTTDDSFLQAAGLLHLLSEGYVEPVEPTLQPFHLFAQQILALVLQEGRIGRRTWREWIGRMPAFAAMAEADLESILDHMVSAGILLEEQEMLSMGPEGERQFGRRNFIDLCSIFTSEPLFTVLHGQEPLGQVHDSTFMVKQGEPVILSLAGRSWFVTHVDWSDRTAWVEPSESPGRSRWIGDSRPLSFKLCRAMRKVLVAGGVAFPLTRRAREKLADLRSEFPWLDDRSTQIVTDPDGTTRWWTFAGIRANRALAPRLPGGEAGVRHRGNIAIRLPGPGDVCALPESLQDPAGDAVSGLPWDLVERVSMSQKFSMCLPRSLIHRLAAARFVMFAEATAVCGEPCRIVREGAPS